MSGLLSMMNLRTNQNSVEGNIIINSISYSAVDILDALQEQGIVLNQVGNNIKIGHKTVAPDFSMKGFDFQSSSNSMNIEIFQDLTKQIQRIFSELTTLKDHLGLNNDFTRGFNVSKPETNFKVEHQQMFSGKWNTINSDKITSKRGNANTKEKIFSEKNDVPIIALGLKNKTANSRVNNKTSIIDEFKDLTASKGISDDEALDNLSNKLFNKANTFLDNSKSKLIDSMQQSEASPSDIEPQLTEPSFSRRCENCHMRIQKEAKFCSKCGNKSIK